MTSIANRPFYDTVDTRLIDDPRQSVIEFVQRDEQSGRTVVSLYVGGQAIGEVVEVLEGSCLMGFDKNARPFLGGTYDDLTHEMEYEIF